MSNAPGARLASGQVMVGSAAGVATPLAITGDLTVSSSGVTAIGASKITSAMGDPTYLKYAAVNISSAELLAINATPKILVAAPGAGFMVMVHRVVCILDYAGAYSSNGVVGIYETNASGQVLTGTLTLAVFLGAGADAIKELHPVAASATTGTTRLDNKAIVFTTATGESTGGTSVVRVHIWYAIIPHGL